MIVRLSWTGGRGGLMDMMWKGDFELSAVDLSSAVMVSGVFVDE